jgi:integration host factor subunit beta
MNKSELIEKLATKSGLGVIQAEEIIRLILDNMRSSLCGGNRIEIRGFGSFSVKPRNARSGRNPKTGDPIEIDAKNFVAFKLGKELRERLNTTS